MRRLGSKIVGIDLGTTNTVLAYFDGILKKHTSEFELTQVKTTNMGSLFRLTYNLTLRTADKEQELINKLRCRNGNLEITVSKQETIIGEL